MVGAVSHVLLPTSTFANGRFSTAVQAGDEDGTILAFDMSPWGWRQVGVDIGGTDGTMVISSTQRAVCFGVVVDDVSNDGTFQLAVPD